MGAVWHEALRGAIDDTGMAGMGVAAHLAVRVLRSLSLVAGVALLAFLVVRLGKDATLGALARALGWQFVLICIPYGLVMAIDTFGWRYAFADNRVPFFRLLAARVAGEAVNAVTAVVPIGGDAIKVWLVRPHVPYRESVVSVIIAKTTITMALVLFLVIGLVLASTAVQVDQRLVIAMLWLLVVEVVGVGGFFLVQCAGLVTRGARLLSRLGALASLRSAEHVDDALQHYYRHEWRRLSLSIGFHLLGWLLGGLEALLILHILQVPGSLATALVIESLGSAVRFATFFVPGSIGALEGANAAAFTALGLDASVGLGFSLIRRGRQLVWIGIGLTVLAATRASDRWASARAPRSAG
jgi:glycosyltransferase 2 family protein